MPPAAVRRSSIAIVLFAKQEQQEQERSSFVSSLLLLLLLLLRRRRFSASFLFSDSFLLLLSKRPRPTARRALSSNLAPRDLSFSALSSALARLRTSNSSSLRAGMCVPADQKRSRTFSLPNITEERERETNNSLCI